MNNFDVITKKLHVPVFSIQTERDGRCPALSQWGVCPSPLRKCSVDEDCRGREKCCMSPCGRACVSPLFTGCEQLRAESLRRARALGGRYNVRVPTCDPNGAFEKVQCEDNVLEAEDVPCWCVDAAGFEIPATRAPSRREVNCSNPRPCGGHTCRMLCPYGFELNPEDGCPICQCRDPCAGVTCPGSLTCQLEEAACLNQPCPPIPTCKRARSLDNICPYGPPLKVEGERPFLCGTTPGKPQCPPLFQCLVQSGNDYGVCCSSSMQLEKQGACPAEEEVDGELYREEESDLVSQRICLQQRMLAQLLSSEAEREGRRGYVPQCSLSTGLFLRRQCSRNRLVCWCVDPGTGVKVHGSMGPAENVKCYPMSSKTSLPNNELGTARSNGRSLCDTRVCAQLCEFGFKAIPRDGCPSCECEDNPCADFKCGPGEECITHRSTEGCLPRDSNCGSIRPICQLKKATEISQPSKSNTKGKVDALEDDAQPIYHDDTNDGSLDPIENRKDTCMGPRDPGRKCYQPSSMRWRFNSHTKLCEQFLFEGCGGNLNNFDTEDACRLVCPAPTKCERARLRSEQLAQRLSKLTGNHAAAGVAATFVPRCVAGSGAWEVVQCLEGANTPLCWCVDPISGTPVKGTISKRKLEMPECEKFIPTPANVPRRRSGKAHRFESDWFSQEEDAVQPLDQLYLESRVEFEEVVLSTVVPILEEEEEHPITTESVPAESPHPLTRCQAMQKNGDMPIGDDHFPVKCDAEGNVTTRLRVLLVRPTRNAGASTKQEINFQTPPHSRGGPMPTPIEAVEIHLGFHGNHAGMKKKAVIASIREMLNKMGAKIKADAIEVESRSSDSDGETTHVQFSLIGPNKVDVAYQLEQMVKAKQVVIDIEMEKKPSKEKDPESFDRKDEALRKMVAEITSSYFSHRPVTSAGQRVIALEHREIILSEGSDEDPAKESALFGGRSSNSSGSSSGAALLGVCAVSSFIICILSVLLMVQRNRSKSNQLDTTKKGVVVNEVDDGGSYYKTNDVVPSPPSSPAPIYVLTTDRIGDRAVNSDPQAKNADYK
ncbi:hypothetical protein J437_LFUL011414 [Ladona fulva]|uniref:Uncharacterized protein n=1 Tax=Ladona fulva TaxID=123851 RepID=A0A8K0KC03_LADFU|nr:hypothetical protein J437_LFUL011414 [Ladona fulva]